MGLAKAVAGALVHSPVRPCRVSLITPLRRFSSPLPQVSSSFFLNVYTISRHSSMQREGNYRATDNEVTMLFPIMRVLHKETS